MVVRSYWAAKAKYDVVKPFDIRLFDHPKPTHDFARIDGGENAPGLLTKK